MSSNQIQKKVFFFLQNQWGFSLVELLISSSIIGLLILGLFQFLFNINRNVVDTTEQFNSIQWNKQIIETLLKEPDCLSASCSDIKSSCTNLLNGFEDQVGTTVNYTALYSDSSNLTTAFKLYVNASDPDYDATKHSYKGLAIDQIVATAGDNSRDDRLTLRVSFKKTETGSRDSLLVQPLILKVAVDEYQSDLIEDSGYSKVKTCHIMGNLSRAVRSACYTVDDSDDTGGSLTTEKGRTLVGCNGDLPSKTSRITAFGYAAGKSNSTGVANTFIGYKSGENNTTESENTFVGNQTGLSITETSDSSIESGHTYIGSRAGESSTTNYHNTFIGNAAGIDTTTGMRNTFIGASAGRLHTEGYDNVMMGAAAGYDSQSAFRNVVIGKDSTLRGNLKGGKENTFVGHYTSRAQTTAGFYSLNQNTFLGYEAGYNKFAGANYSLRGSYDDTVFIGYRSGYSQYSGEGTITLGSLSAYKGIHRDSVIVGSRAAYLSGGSTNYNLFLGSKAGYRNKVDNNIFIGYRSGNIITTGKYNIFIGSEDLGMRAGAPYSTSKEVLNIGNLILGKRPRSVSSGNPKISALSSSGEVIIYGNLLVEGNLYYKDKLLKKGVAVTPMCISDSPVSSRVYKKNIQPFTYFERALKDIESTPLFYYEYKHDHPDKRRMGIISEELPEHLQIRDEGVPSIPDWVSIYGTLWAGIKALSNSFSMLKVAFFQLVKKTRMELVQQWEFQQMILKKQLADLKVSMNQKNEDGRIHRLQTKENFKQDQNELQILKKKLEEKRRILKNNNKMISELNNTLTELKEINKKLAITQGLIQGTRDRLQSNHERLTRIEDLIQ